MADRRLRRWNRGRVVRAVPVLAARDRADRSIRLAEHTADFRRNASDDAAAVARAGRAAEGAGLGALYARRAERDPGAGGGAWPPQLCAAHAWLLHLRLSALLHHRAP